MAHNGDTTPAYVNHLKKCLKGLLGDTLDHFEVLQLSIKVCFDLPQDKDLSQQKYELQRFLILQLLKVDKSETASYRRLLNETEQCLSTRKSEPYTCCLIGCLFKTDVHRKYLVHLKAVHSSHTQLLCNFKKKCARTFSSLKLLLAHVQDCHSNQCSENPTIEIDCECRCNMLSCGGLKFKSTSLLLKHMNSFHKNECRSCIFDNCCAQFDKGAVARDHVRKKHLIPGLTMLKPEHIVERSYRIQTIPPELIDSRIESTNDENICDLLYNDDEVPTELQNNANGDDENYFKMQYADFLNRMCNVSYVPAKKVTEIADSFLLTSLKSREIRRRKLLKALENVKGLSQSDIDRITEEGIENDIYLNAQMELNTEFKRNKYIEDNFKYIPPVQITLNKSKVITGDKADVIHYIPVKESFRALVQDKSFNDVLVRQRNLNLSRKNVIQDLKDGEVYKSSSFFSNNPSAFAALFYSDGVEVSNPLGWAKGRHKVVQVFYTLCEIPRCQRSQIDRTQLCMVFKEKLLKKYGYDTIFKPLVEDLKELEIGIEIQYPFVKTIQLGVLAYSADNLESHNVGGFSSCFSSRDICRFCHIEHSQLVENIHDFDGEKMMDYWSQEEYDKICDSMDRENDVVDSSQVDSYFTVEADMSMEEGDGSCSDLSDAESEDGSTKEKLKRFGITRRCPFNALESFHAVTSLPPDCMHDLLGRSFKLKGTLLFQRLMYVHGMEGGRGGMDPNQIYCHSHIVLRGDSKLGNDKKKLYYIRILEKFNWHEQSGLFISFYLNGIFRGCCCSRFKWWY